jgi:hypothetical protein
VSVHVPAPAVIVTAYPIALHTPLVVSVTGMPELALGATVTVTPNACGLGGAGKVIDCGAGDVELNWNAPTVQGAARLTPR